MDYQDPSWQIVDKKRIEIDVDTGVIRTEEETWLAEPTKENLGLDMPTVDQSGYELRLTEGSEQVTVTGTKFGADITFTLPNLDAPAQQNMYDGVVSFYSESMDRLYFIYPTVDSSYSIASCVLDANSPTCVVSASDMDFFDIDKVSSQVKVYDSMQLVALPVVCCFCVEKKYFVFDEATVLKEVDILSLPVNPIAVDSRIAMAYALSGGYENDLLITFESISIDSIISKVEDTLMTSEEMVGIFWNQGSLVPVATPIVTPISAVTMEPVTNPTGSPIDSPTVEPVAIPTSSPISSITVKPVVHPSGYPTSPLTMEPVAIPTGSPINSVTRTPVASPTASPINSPTKQPVTLQLSLSSATPASDSPVVTPNVAPATNHPTHPNAAPVLSQTNSPTASYDIPTAVQVTSDADKYTPTTSPNRNVLLSTSSANSNVWGNLLNTLLLVQIINLLH